MNISIKNWSAAPSSALALATSIVATFMAFADQIISLLHEAPFPVPASVDAWITWTLKVATLTLSILTVFTKGSSAQGTDLSTSDQ